MVESESMDDGWISDRYVWGNWRCQRLCRRVLFAWNRQHRFLALQELQAHRAVPHAVPHGVLQPVQQSAVPGQLSGYGEHKYDPLEQRARMHNDQYERNGYEQHQQSRECMFPSADQHGNVRCSQHT